MSEETGVYPVEETESLRLQVKRLTEDVAALTAERDFRESELDEKRARVEELAQGLCDINSLCSWEPIAQKIMAELDPRDPHRVPNSMRGQ